MSEDRSVVLRGRALCPRLDGAGVDTLDDARVVIGADGRIASVSPAGPRATEPETFPGCVLLPGLVDAHMHFPQLRVLGSASGPLLEWLAGAVFPEEARFADRAYAAAVAAELCDAFLAQGTTCAAIYSSSHPDATDVLFAELDRRGLRALAGLTLMDRGAPDGVRLDAGAALEACARLRERWHGHDAGRLQLCVTPRYALSCTPDLLRAAGRFAAEHDLPIQTHLAEHPAELAATAAAFPGAADYLGVYADHGLCTPRTIFGHCIWLEDAAWDRLAAAGAAVAHCPDSNFFLGSGRMPLRAATDRGVRVGLGTDVGAGRTFSLRRIAASAYDNALARGEPGPTAEELLWLATAGGARALGLGAQIGHLAPGFEADLIAVPLPDHLETWPRRLDALVFHQDAGPVRAAYVRGRRLV